VIVVSKKGPHREWAEDHLPEHLWAGIETNVAVWGDNPRVRSLLRSNEPKGRRLEILAVNHDALRGTRFKDQIEDFLLKHEGSCLVLIDESHRIKNPSSKTHEAACELGERVDQRGIATGTPLSGHDLTDEWAQFYFLDKNIIGIEYKSTFRAQFCVMHGQGKDAFVVGSKNVQQFNSIIAPYTYRASKEDDMDLPKKLPPHTIAFDLSDQQLRVQKSLRENFLALLDDGSVTIKNAITLVTKLQTLACGYMVNDDGVLVPFDENPRLDAYLDFIKDQPQAKRIVWARFVFDIEALKKAFGDNAVTYYGGDDDKQKKKNLAAFMDPKSDIDYIIANGASMGTGTDGLQKVCHHSDFYSQQFNAIERIQCEDRIHRGGTTEICHYNDVAANSSIDKKVIASLRRKISFTDLTLADLRRLIDGL
jgi:SNF2 family DNA or RNA helicase